MNDLELDNQRFAVAATAEGWSISGEIDASTVPRLVDAFERLPEHDGAVVLDLQEVSFIDSSGLRVFISLVERAGEDGRTVVLANPSNSVLRLLEITGLAGMFGMDPRPPA
jgi:anti-sigma B factor antagonist